MASPPPWLTYRSFPHLNFRVLQQQRLSVPYGFSAVAAQAINCHRSMLEGGCLDHRRCSAHIEFLKGLPQTREEDDVLYVHASPRDPLVEYVLKSDVACGPNRKIREIFDMIEGACFVGHSHKPGVITSDFQWLSPEEANGMEISRAKFVVNVGSVGQPRDGDPRACYVEWDDARIHFHRVEYPFRKTMMKIKAMGCLDNYCAERLAKGE